MTNCAPVVLFVYKRADKTKETLEALGNNLLADETEVFIYADGAKGDKDVEDVQEVRKFIHNYSTNHPFKNMTLHESEINKGLAHSVIAGVTEVINQFGRAIIVEDDLITSKDFLQYLNDGLTYYENNKEMGSISAYTYPIKGLQSYNHDIYITRKGDCWGWATWSDRWNGADWNVSNFDEYVKNRAMRRDFESIQKGIDGMLCSQMSGDIDSWAVRWVFHLFCNKQLTAYPKVSRTRNIGFDGTGTHCGETSIFGDRVNDSIKKCEFENIKINKKLEREAAVFESGTFWMKVKRVLRKI